MATSLIVRLLAHVDHGAGLSAVMTERLAAAAGALGGDPDAVAARRPGTVLALRIEQSDGRDAAQLEAAARSALGDAPVDVLVTRADLFSATAGWPAVLIADMESTIIGQECLDELADYVGKRAEVEEITRAAMRDEIDFAGAIRARVALLKGLPETTLDEVYRERVRPNPGARQFISALKAQGTYCALVSGGFSFFTARVAADLGFDEDRANTLEIVDGHLTGAVVPPILGRDSKRAALEEICALRGVGPHAALAIGDGANDSAMLEAVAEADGLAVAYHAKPVLRALANLRIDHGGLDAVLHVLGPSSAAAA